MGFNLWNAQLNPDGFTPNETTLKDSADGVVASGLLAAGYNIFLWDADPLALPTRNAAGNLQYSTTDYPSGMAALVAYVHAAGLKFGAYSGGGTLTCSGGSIGSYNHEIEDAALFVGWGADYLKWDVICYWGSDSPYYFKNSYEKVCRALYALNPDFICAGGPGQISFAPYIESTGTRSARVGGDADPSDAWNSVLVGFTALAGYEQYCGPDHWCDLDALLVGHGLTDAEGQTQMALWSLLASPLFVGADVRAGALSANSLATLTNADVIAVDQDALGIVGKKASSATCGATTCEVWAKPLSGGACAVGLFNRDSEAHDITATFADVAAVFSACGSGPYTATKNLWTGANPGTLTTSYTAEAVPAHGVVMLRVAP